MSVWYKDGNWSGLETNETPYVLMSFVEYIHRKMYYMSRLPSSPVVAELRSLFPSGTSEDDLPGEYPTWPTVNGPKQNPTLADYMGAENNGSVVSDFFEQCVSLARTCGNRFYAHTDGLHNTLYNLDSKNTSVDYRAYWRVCDDDGVVFSTTEDWLAYVAEKIGVMPTGIPRTQRTDLWVWLKNLMDVARRYRVVTLLGEPLVWWDDDIEVVLGEVLNRYSYRDPPYTPGVPPHIGLPETPGVAWNRMLSMAWTALTVLKTHGRTEIVDIPSGQDPGVSASSFKEATYDPADPGTWFYVTCYRAHQYRLDLVPFAFQNYFTTEGDLAVDVVSCSRGNTARYGYSNVADDGYITMKIGSTEVPVPYGTASDLVFPSDADTTESPNYDIDLTGGYPFLDSDGGDASFSISTALQSPSTESMMNLVTVIDIPASFDSEPFEIPT